MPAKKTSPSLRVPVVFFIFKRPDTTRRVFETIAQARPAQLFVVADGPRTADEAPVCDSTRAIVQAVDWECEVHTNYSDTNLGLKRRITSGLNWVFEQVEQAIILEDDCLPDPTFFRFCAELLDQYRETPQVMHINGSNSIRSRLPLAASYFFSRYVGVWGWATWRRAWQHFDVDMTLWTKAIDRSSYLDYFPNPKERLFWRTIWDQVSAGQIDTWDFQWMFTCLAHGGLAAIPRDNLVSNIGFGSHATHTQAKNRFAALPTTSMSFPLVHPDDIGPDRELEKRLGKLALVKPPLHQRIINRLNRVVARLLSLYDEEIKY